MDDDLSDAVKDAAALGAASLALQRESYREALDLLTGAADSPAVLWTRGVALSGRGWHRQALAALRAAEPGLEGTDRALCVIHQAATHLRADAPLEAARRTMDARVLCDAGGFTRGALVCDFLGVLAHFQAGRFEDYLTGYRLIADSLMAEGEVGWAAQALAGAAFSHHRLGRHRLTPVVARELLELANRAGLLHRAAAAWHALAANAYGLDELDAAWDRATRSRDLAEQAGADIQVAEAMVSQALTSFAGGDSDDAAQRLIAALELFRGCEYTRGLSVCHTNLAFISFVRGRLQATGMHATQSEQLAESVGDRRVLGIARLNLGAVHTLLSNSARAERYFELALNDLLSIGVNPLAAQAASFRTAVCAPERFDEHAAFADDLVMRCEPGLDTAIAVRVLAEHLARYGRLDEARDKLERAIRMVANSPEQWAITGIRLAECELERLHAGRPGITRAQVRALLQDVSARSLALPEIRMRAGLAHADLDLHGGDSRAALTHLTTAMSSAQMLRMSGNDPVLSSFAGRTFDHVYRRGSALALELGEPALALLFAEHRRAQWLAANIAAQTDAGTPDARRQPTPELDALAGAMRELRAKRADLARRVNAGNTSAEDDARRLEADIERRYLALDETALFFSGAADIRAIAPVVGVDGLIAAFATRFGEDWTAVLLEPQSSDGERWLQILLSSSGVVARSMTAPAVIRGSLRALAEGDPGFRRRSVAATTDRKNWLARVADWLGVGNWIASARAPDHALIVCDAGWLARIQMWALPVAGGDRLGDRCALRHTPSLNVAAMQAAATRRRPTRTALVVAPLEFGGRHPALPVSCEEAEQVTAHLRSAGYAVTELTGDGATLSAIRAVVDTGEMSGYDFVHLATHACAEPERARLSSLALRDGDVTVQEILSWRLSAQLVVVSGCESTFAVTFGGEERIGLEMALVGAGARAVVSSHWPVNDAATARVMATFARQYAQRDDPAVALSHAQRECARQVQASDVAAWRVFGLG